MFTPTLSPLQRIISGVPCAHGAAAALPSSCAARSDSPAWCARRRPSTRSWSCGSPDPKTPCSRPGICLRPRARSAPIRSGWPRRKHPATVPYWVAQRPPLRIAFAAAGKAVGRGQAPAWARRLRMAAWPLLVGAKAAWCLFPSLPRRRLQPPQMCCHSSGSCRRGYALAAACGLSHAT
jgi:hypothetical protein